MKTFKTYKRENIVALVIGIFLFYTQPILDYLGKLFVQAFLLTIKSFSNFYYISVSQNNNTAFSSHNNFLLIIIFSLIIFFYILDIKEKKKSLMSEIDNIFKEINRLEERITRKERENLLTEEEILINITTLKEENVKNHERISKYNKLFIMFNILSYIFILLLFYNHAINMAIASENLKFRNDIIKIAPWTCETELKTIEAKWASMKNKYDYKVIKGTIESIKLNSYC